MSIYAPAADFIWELVKAEGIDPAPLFYKAGIDPKIRLNPLARIPRTAVNKLNEVVYEATGDVAIGVRATENFHPSHFGPLGYSWLTSSSLRVALQRLQRYSRLMADTLRIDITDIDAETCVQFYWDGSSPQSSIQYYSNMALLVRLCRLIMGLDYNPLRVEFLDSAPDDLEPFEQRFRCPLYFNCEKNLLVLDRGTLDNRLPRAHPALAQMHDELAIKYLADLDKNDIISLVKTAIIDLMPEGRATVEDVASKLNTSVRTLRRRLDAKELSFREMLSEQRKEYALRFIRDESLTLTEISYLLGFSEPSSFSRAYRGWTGESPTVARNSLHAG
jgi:AraC-like DNA-binding protein